MKLLHTVEFDGVASLKCMNEFSVDHDKYEKQITIHGYVVVTDQFNNVREKNELFIYFLCD